jgi:hypothetical protein
MTAVRLDRAEVRLQLAGHPAEIVTDLLNAFEGAALTALATKTKPSSSGGDKSIIRRERARLRARRAKESGES